MPLGEAATSIRGRELDDRFENGVFENPEVGDEDAYVAIQGDADVESIVDDVDGVEVLEVSDIPLPGVALAKFEYVEYKTDLVDE